VLTPEPGLGVPDVGLGDVLPDPANIPPGCRFHPRCPIAEPRCSIETPRLKPSPAAAWSVCWCLSLLGRATQRRDHVLPDREPPARYDRERAGCARSRRA